MAYPLAAALAAGLGLLVASGAHAQTPALENAADPVETSLSPECRVPGSRLYTLASLRRVKRALKEQRRLKVLAIGSSSTEGVGASSPTAAYPARLEAELERLFPPIDVEMHNRGVGGEVAAAAAQRMKEVVAEIRPDLVVWQVGTNDAMARIDVDSFAATLSAGVEWLKAQRIDLALVDPQYTPELARDSYYAGIVRTIETVARDLRVPLVRRYEGMRFMAARAKGEAYLARDHLHLNDLGYRCMAEHVARALTVSLLIPDPPAPAEPPPRPEPPAVTADATRPGATAAR